MNTLTFKNTCLPAVTSKCQLQDIFTDDCWRLFQARDVKHNYSQNTQTQTNLDQGSGSSKEVLREQLPRTQAEAASSQLLQSPPSTKYQLLQIELISNITFLFFFFPLKLPLLCPSLEQHGCATDLKKGVDYWSDSPFFEAVARDHIWWV